MEQNHFVKSQTVHAHPQEKANFLSKIFFCWTGPVFKISMKRELTESDLYKTKRKLETARLIERFEKSWNEQLRRNLVPSLWKSIGWNFKWDFVHQMIIYFILTGFLRILRPVALGKLLGYYSPTENVSKDEAILYACIIILISFIDAMMSHYWILANQEMSLKIKVSVSSLIYKKSLKLSKGALSETTIGHIINLLSNDMEKITFFFRTFNDIWSCPIEMTLSLYFLYTLSGPTSFTGLVFLVVITPIQFYASKKSAFYRLKIALLTDKRIRYMSEIISGIQVIKVYTWEKPFIKLIDTIRRKEVHFIKIANFLDALTTSFTFFLDRTAIFISILIYVLTGHSPDAAFVFIISAYYEILMGSVSQYLPEGLTSLFQARVSMKRFHDFLLLEEIEKTSIAKIEPGIIIKQATAKWAKNLSQDALTDVNFTVGKGQLVAVIGPIGCGKSSLLQVCLEELPLVQGTIEIGGTISYANQEPWLFAGTVRQNILFGEVFNTARYKEVLKVCALEDDIINFPYGDNTIVGERGILLSGGQKARISLARTCYKEADIYLLDDPLSAVDAKVGKYIFNNCISKFLSSKSVILVTHQVQFLNSVDQIYLLNEGAISACGTFKELQRNEEKFTSLLKDFEEFDEEHDNTQLGEFEEKEKQDELSETRQVGKVSKKVYLEYFKAATNCGIVIIILALFIATEMLATGADYFVAFWVNLEEMKYNNATAKIIFNTQECVYIYSFIVCGLIVASMSRSFSFVKICMRASINLHDKMFSTIVNATMSFFYSNSSGRILNRFAKDIGSLDETLPEMLMNAIEVTLAVIGTTLAICLVSPLTFIPTLAIVVIMYFLRSVYINASRSLKRIEATRRSPIFAHFTESMKGLTTIRAFKAEKILEDELSNLYNSHTSAYHMSLVINRAFATWLDVICVIYVSIVTTIALNFETYAGNVGFMITQGMSLTGMFQWCLRRLSDVENEMTSVERVTEYVNLKRETSDGKEPQVDWPEKGKIEFRSVNMQYSSTEPLVLRNLNISIAPGEKIGIVGRTGAGKSSLIAVLFRLVNYEGNILIDNIDTKEIQLSALRSKISIIPQEPMLFSGSVRKNLDPFDKFNDDVIWNVLDKVNLKQFVQNLPAGLYSEMLEGGSNFSVGQKQLICLVRALLQNNKILILDEATANVDPQTDELLQSTIRNNFKDCTVLTIAHRLHTIMDADKVLMMDDAQVVEFDHPHVLLEEKRLFYALVMETGKKMGENLTEIAKENYKSKNV